MKPGLKTAIDAAACDAEWIETRREIVARCGMVLRAGDGHRIEIRFPGGAPIPEADRGKTSPWCWLMLPNEAPAFATAEDRDAILARLRAPAAAAPAAQPSTLNCGSAAPS